MQLIRINEKSAPHSVGLTKTPLTLASKTLERMPYCNGVQSTIKLLDKVKDGIMELDMDAAAIVSRIHCEKLEHCDSY